jgi:hypothetical protein
MTHALKTWPEYYKAVDSGEKTFEVRRFDRPFKVGDTLLLQEWDYTKGQYTGKELKRHITYILSGDVNKFGLFADFCVMGIKELDY